MPLNPSLAKLAADARVVARVEAAAARAFGVDAAVVQGNATLYSDATNASLADHLDGAPFSVVVHLAASEPASSGLEAQRADGAWDRVLFASPGEAAFLRGDEVLHRSVPVARGHERLVLVFFLDAAGAARAPHPAAATPADVSVVAAAAGAGAVAGAVAGADLVVAVAADVPRRAPGVPVAHFAAAPDAAADFAFAGPPRRTLAHALGLA